MINSFILKLLFHFCHFCGFLDNFKPNAFTKFCNYVFSLFFQEFVGINIFKSTFQKFYHTIKISTGFFGLRNFNFAESEFQNILIIHKKQSKSKSTNFLKKHKKKTKVLKMSGHHLVNVQIMSIDFPEIKITPFFSQLLCDHGLFKINLILFMF